MSSSLIASYDFIGKQIFIYIGTINFVGGLLGGCLNILVFLSLRTFRQSSCAFYLTIMSIVNVGYLLISVFPRLMTTIYNSDGTEYSLFYCKFKTYCATICTTMSLTCFCLATIDQYCATCSRPRFQQWCNIKLAQRLVLIFIILWILHATPYLFLFYHSVVASTNKTVCTMTDTIYIQYRAYGLSLVLTGFLPVSIAMLCGLMAYHNLQQIAHYTLPIVRRELDKQLTVMVLTQIIVNCLVIIPFTIVNALLLNTNLNNDPFVKAQIQLSFNIIFAIFYSYYTSSFYIYMCVSERFRRQLFYVLFKIRLNRCKPQTQLMNNQIVPQT